MDAARYARVRELFLAAEELPPNEQEPFLKVQSGDDLELLQEVLSLLAEHDPESAQIEGERAIPVPAPTSVPTISGSTIRRAKPEKAFGHETTRRSDSAGPTQESEQKQEKLADYKTRCSAYSRRTSLRRYTGTQTTPGSLLWAERTRQSRRRTSGWLWLAALLPTALIGWWTYRQVESTIRTVRPQRIEGNCRQRRTCVGSLL